MLMHCGIHPKTHRQQRVLAKQLDNKPSLDFQGIVTLVAQFYHDLAHEIVETMGNGNGCIPVRKLIVALYEVGEHMTRERCHGILEQVGVSEDNEVVDEATFSKILDILRRESILEWRATCGWLAEDMSFFHWVWSDYSDNKDTVLLENILKVLSEIGYAPHPHQKLLMDVLTRVDRGGTGRLHFQELLLLLRHLERKRLEALMKQEQKAAEDLSLDDEGLSLFRKLFSEHAVMRREVKLGMQGRVAQHQVKV